VKKNCPRGNTPLEGGGEGKQIVFRRTRPRGNLVGVAPPARVGLKTKKENLVIGVLKDMRTD